MNYNKDSFKERQGSLESAEIIVPMIIKLLNPKSVVDLGCGNGEFLAKFKQDGIEDILGIEGEWIDKENLLIPKGSFIHRDLQKKIILNKKFDLAVFMEVAEHLKPESSKIFIKNVIDLSDIIIFSAGIPFQRGLGHINENWITYWADLFKEHRYIAVDMFRNKLWDDERVLPFYAQNIMIFAKKEKILKNKILKEEYERSNGRILNLIHPYQYLQNIRRYENMRRVTPLFIRWTCEKIIQFIKIIINKIKPTGSVQNTSEDKA